MVAFIDDVFARMIVGWQISFTRSTRSRIIHVTLPNPWARDSSQTVSGEAGAVQSRSAPVCRLAAREMRRMLRAKGERETRPIGQGAGKGSDGAGGPVR